MNIHPGKPRKPPKIDFQSILAGCRCGIALPLFIGFLPIGSNYFPSSEKLATQLIKNRVSISIVKDPEAEMSMEALHGVVRKPREQNRRARQNWAIVRNRLAEITKMGSQVSTTSGRQTHFRNQ